MAMPDSKGIRIEYPASRQNAQVTWTILAEQTAEGHDRIGWPSRRLEAIRAGPSMFEYNFRIKAYHTLGPSFNPYIDLHLHLHLPLLFHHVLDREQRPPRL